MNFSDRLLKALNVSRLSQSELARRLEVKPQSVQQWLSGKNFPRHLRLAEIALTLNVAESWLATGVGPMTYNDLVKHWEKRTKNKRNKPPTLPVYSWIDISKKHGTIDLGNTVHDVIDRPFPCSKEAFSLQVCDNSMVPYFCIGEFIVVEPNANFKIPHEGKTPCFVIVRAYNEPFAVLRQLALLDERPYLITTELCGQNTFSKYDENWTLYGLTVGKIELFGA